MNKDTCWFCGKLEENDKNILFSTEFDAYVHEECLKKTLEKNPEHAEAKIMGRELLEVEFVGEGKVTPYQRGHQDYIEGKPLNEKMSKKSEAYFKGYYDCKEFHKAIK